MKRFSSANNFVNEYPPFANNRNNIAQHKRVIVRSMLRLKYELLPWLKGSFPPFSSSGTFCLALYTERVAALRLFTLLKYYSVGDCALIWGSKVAVFCMPLACWLPHLLEYTEHVLKDISCEWDNWGGGLKKPFFHSLFLQALVHMIYFSWIIKAYI